MPSSLSKLLLGSFVALSILASGVRPADACRCLPPDLVRSYNESTDVLRVRVALKIPLREGTVYLARVGATYKGCLEPRQWVLLVTPSSSAACGVDLARGGDYLISAAAPRPGSRALWIASCGFNMPFPALDDRQIGFLDTRYNCCGDDCGCVNSDPVSCFADPCEVASCPEGNCLGNYCGGCNAEFYDEFGQAVCQPCKSADDCGFGQQCSSSGQCLGSCQSDADCADDAWCRPNQDRSAECTPFQQEGEVCGGFTPVWGQLRCAPDLVCTDFPPGIADAPGICRSRCEGNEDCPERQYCANDRVCRDDGACRKSLDCQLPGNAYPHIACVGHGVCSESSCGWSCGPPGCLDLTGADFGACEALLGWGMVDGACAPVSGCSSPDVRLFGSQEECRRACEPSVGVGAGGSASFGRVDPGTGS